MRYFRLTNADGEYRFRVPENCGFEKVSELEVVIRNDDFDEGDCGTWDDSVYPPLALDCGSQSDAQAGRSVYTLRMLEDYNAAPATSLVPASLEEIRAARDAAERDGLSDDEATLDRAVALAEQGRQVFLAFDEDGAYAAVLDVPVCDVDSCDAPATRGHETETGQYCYCDTHYEDAPADVRERWDIQPQTAPANICAA